MSIECILLGQAKGEVESFNGRKGAITSQSGDYTAAQVGALPLNGTAVKANEATKLSTQRTIQTDLSSTTAANFDGTTNITLGVTGILPIANGGTGVSNQSEIAEALGARQGTAVAADTFKGEGITLDGDVTIGDNELAIPFDGSRDISIPTKFPNTGVIAGNYGSFLNGLCWIANNRGVASSIATWTLTAKKAGTFRFLYAGSGQQNSDYLTVTIKGTEVINTSSMVPPYGGHHEATLTVGDVVVFKYTENNSTFSNGDYAGIGDMSLGDLNTQFDPITPDNIDTYFTVADGEYTFEPMMVFTGSVTTVNAKGFVTSAKNIYPAIYTLDEWESATNPSVPPYDWGDETAVGDAAWWAGLKEWVLKTTPKERLACVGKKKKVSLAESILGANDASMICIGADQDGNKTLTFQTENILPNKTKFGTSASWNGSTAQLLCNNFGNQCSASASLKSITKLTSDDYTNSSIQVETTANCWLPSLSEMGLTRQYNLSDSEWTKGISNPKAYSYYISDERRIKTNDIYDETYWVRSRVAYEGSRALGGPIGPESVCTIGPEGGSDWSTDGYYECTATTGLAPAFVIG